MDKKVCSLSLVANVNGLVNENIQVDDYWPEILKKKHDGY